MFKIWCLVEGDRERPFSIKPSEESDIYDLKVTIKNAIEKNGDHQPINIRQSVLWMPLPSNVIRVKSTELIERTTSLFRGPDRHEYFKLLKEADSVAETFKNRDQSKDPLLDIYIELPAQAAQPILQWSTPSRDNTRKRKRVHSEETVPGDTDQLFHNTPTKSLTEVKDDIDRVLDRYRLAMQRLVTKAGRMPLLPIWVPKTRSGNATQDMAFRRHIDKLKIPAVRGFPSLLLHELGSVTSVINEKQAQYISDIFSSDRHSVVINTRGSGKTRIGLQGLCHNWGFYGVLTQSADGIGSGDLEDLMSTLDDSRDYLAAKDLIAKVPETQNKHAESHMRNKVKHRVLQFLLSRLLVLNMLIEEASNCEGGLRISDHRLLWVLLQAQPSDILGEDIFLEIANTLRMSKTEDIKSQIMEEYTKFRPILEREPVKTGKKHRPLYCFLDEIQHTTSTRVDEFRSQHGDPRPLLRPIWEALTKIFPEWKMLVILSGTTISERSLENVLVSDVFKINPYSIKRELGAFDDADIQKKYLSHYLPEAGGQHEFLKRAWGWCRGRYRSTATLISLILTNGPHSPHKILNVFVKSSTNFSPTDGRVADERDEPSVGIMMETPIGFDFGKLDVRQIDLLRDALHSQIVYGYHSPLPWTPEDEAAFIEHGFARTKLGTNVFDEPLAIIAAWDWLDSNGHHSLLDCLRRDIDKHSPRKNGLEAYLTFYLRKVFEKTPKLDDVFAFRSDFARRKDSDLRWQKEEFELVTVSVPADTNQRMVSIVTPSCGPSQNVGRLAETDDHVVDWITKNEETYAFCFLTDSAGPDIIFFVRHKETGKLLLVAVQAKRYNDVDRPTLLHGVRTVTPSFLWKSKNKNILAGEASDSPSDVASEFLGALAKNQYGIIAPNAEFPILRIFASWPADAKLERTLEFKESEADPDMHPLAALHLENFNHISSQLANSSCRNKTEQDVVVFVEREYDDIMLRRSKRLKT